MSTFSPVVVQRKVGAPSEGSHNPFDDFDVLTAPFADAPRESADSCDYSFLFESAGESASSSSLRSRSSSSADYGKGGLDTMRASHLRNEVTIPHDDDVKEDEEDSEGTEREKHDSDQGPNRPSRTKMPIHWATSLNEPSIPWASTDADLYRFVQTPFEERCAMRMTLIFDPVARSFAAIQESTNRTVLIALRRTDGLKSLAFSTNYAILLSAGDNSSCREAVKICKLRSNAMCSQYSLFDSGKSPSKAAGVIEVRRELMGVKFECVSGIYTRRAVYCALPKPEQTRRPLKREETLVERMRNRDAGVSVFSPFVPDTTPARLPRLEDFHGFATAHSVKNTMLHDPRTKQVVFRLGRSSETIFNVEFAHPFSIATAFALAVACCDTKVHPNRQF